MKKCEVSGWSMHGHDHFYYHDTCVFVVQSNDLIAYMCIILEKDGSETVTESKRKKEESIECAKQLLDERKKKSATFKDMRESEELH